MSTQIEARRLSGEHVGRTATITGHLARELVQVEHSVVGVWLLFDMGATRGDMRVRLAPTDLVTIHDDRTTTPTPKETP